MESIDLASIVSVAHNRMTSLRQMGPDLMFAPAFQASLYKRGLPEALQHTNMGNSPLPFCLIFGGISLVSCVLGKIRLNPAHVLPDASLDDGHILSSRTVVPELILQMPLGVFGFGEDQQPRCLPIQPVNNEDFLWRLFIFDICIEK